MVQGNGHPKSIVLIGFAASGKSTVGPILASRLEIAFVDLDAEVIELNARRSGERLSCPDIFARLGRAGFAELECLCLERLCETHHRPMVLATGGGVVMHEKSRHLLASLGTVVYLALSPETIFRRLARRGMPKFLGDSPTVATVARELERRRPYYESLAQITIDSDCGSADEIADTVLANLDRTDRQ